MDEIRLELFIRDTELDDDRLDQLARNLMRDLRDLGAEAVKQSSDGEIPKGAKGLESILVGGLTLSAFPELMPKLFDFLQVWDQRPNTRTVKIKTEKGIEVEFTPQKRMTTDEIAEFVKKLDAPTILRP